MHLEIRLRLYWFAGRTYAPVLMGTKQFAVDTGSSQQRACGFVAHEGMCKHFVAHFPSPQYCHSLHTSLITTDGTIDI
jgi:uncharacterized protein (DUF1800 family)